MKKIFAFTLAETLIVMGVIGIVSALTLPNLNSLTGDKERVAKVKKIYQNLNDALGRAEAVYGPYEQWFINDTTDQAKAKRVGERLVEFMKVSKDCSTTTNQKCMNNNYDTNDKFYKVILADGTSFATAGPVNANQIFVDIDGPAKGSGSSGKDFFVFIFSDDGVIPSGYKDSFADLIQDCLGLGKYPSTWIIKYDNADYLQFQSVSGSTATCKNGNTVTEANPRCK